MEGFQQTLKRVLDGDFDVASDAEKERAVQRLIQTGCAAATIAALQPVPGLDVALIMPIQVGMVQGIGRVHGYHLDRKSVVEVLRNVKTGIVTQQATLVAAKLIPAVGTVLAACVAPGLTYAVGIMGEHYFRSGRSMLPEAMRAMLQRTYAEYIQKTCKSKWDEACALICGRPTAAKRLKQVEQARRDGRVTDDEAEQRIAEIVSPPERGRPR